MPVNCFSRSLIPREALVRAKFFSDVPAKANFKASDLTCSKVFLPAASSWSNPTSAIKHLFSAHARSGIGGRGRLAQKRCSR